MIIVLSCGITVWMFYELFIKCIRNKKVYINHIFCFTIGLFYYGIVPILIFEFDAQFNDSTYYVINHIYHTLTVKNKLIYVGILYLIFGCFLLGNKISVFRLEIRIRKLLEHKSFQFSESIWYLPILLLGVFCIYLNRYNLLKGYTAGHNQFKGMYSAYISLVFSLFLLHAFGKKKNGIFVRGGLIKCKWAISYIVFATFLLSMGGRLYVVTHIIALLVFISSYYRKGIKIKDIFFVGSMLIVVIGIVGVIRLGNVTTITLNGVFFNILQESIYESYSLITYLKNYEILNYMSVPSVLAGSLINIIPSIIWSEKVNFMTDIYQIVPAVKSPLGGMHFYVSFIADAGVILTLFGIIILGVFLGTMYRNKEKNSDTKNVIYCLISANLMFTFYRDPVSVSLVKNILENSILIPFFIMLVNNILVSVTRRK